MPMICRPLLRLGTKVFLASHSLKHQVAASTDQEQCHEGETKKGTLDVTLL